MNARGPTLWLALFSVACVVALVVLDQEHLGPGPLTTTHGSVDSLAGREGCEVCHPAGERSLADACGDCHGEIEEQLAGGFGLHGTLPSGTSSNCGGCHPEHHGDELELSGSRAFRLAGLTGPEGFGHERLGFALGGRHLELECAACHVEADAHPLPEGETRFLGLGSECIACHEDPHRGALGQDCAACHGERDPFPRVAEFTHPSSFPLVGAHGRPGCVDCHATEGPDAISELLVEGSSFSATCVDCHPSPHGDGFMAAVQATLRADLDGSCLACHDPMHTFGEPDPIAGRRLHTHTGFDLEGPHGELECSACHGSPEGVDAQFEARFPGRISSECAACHQDPHGGQFEGHGGPQRSCLDCHRPHGFRPSRIDADLHASLGFPLLGAHGTLECGACHVAAVTGEPIQYRGTPTACAACHDDVHSGFFATQARDDLRDRASDCSTCHLPDAFTPAGAIRASQDAPEVVADVEFDHGAWTAFELRGAHGGTDCKACHPSDAGSSGSGSSNSGPPGAERVRGWSREFFGYEGPSPACADCHLDVHGGRFEGATGTSGELLGSPTCDNCHDENAFGGEGSRGFDHAAWTGFGLLGAHSRISCESCHGVGDSVSTQAWTPGRSLGFVEQAFGPGPHGCASCHLDPHGGRFDGPGLPDEIDGRRSCERCHDVEGFTVRARSGFDHGAWTGFELEGLHRALACVACHVPSPEETDSDRNGLGRTQGSACQDCHADPHLGQFDEPGSGTNCQSCHRSDAPFREPEFDHDRDSTFKLDATHRGLDCGSCHTPWELPGGQSVVRYKPLGRACVDCHDPGIGGGGR